MPPALARGKQANQQHSGDEASDVCKVGNAAAGIAPITAEDRVKKLHPEPEEYVEWRGNGQTREENEEQD